LLLASVCYLLSEAAIFGLAAVFLFNVTMPLTLYLLADKFPNQPGFAFGLLTFGLFLGFLPVYFNWALPVSGSVLGCMGSVMSLLLLLPVVWRAKE
jgi:FSR family fosmidomycin resistance protein-like MFS transporter